MAWLFVCACVSSLELQRFDTAAVWRVCACVLCVCALSELTDGIERDKQDQ